MNGGAIISALDCQSRGPEVKSLPEQNLHRVFCPKGPTLTNPAKMSTPTVHCRWEDEMARVRTDHPRSYAEAKKMKLLTHTHVCLRAIAKGLFFSSSRPIFLGSEASIRFENWSPLWVSLQCTYLDPLQKRGTRLTQDR